MALTWTQRSTPTAFDNLWKAVEWSPDLNLFCAVGAVNAAGTDSHRIMTSPDGITWTARDSGVTAANTWAAITWAPAEGLFIVVKASGTNRVATSPDGITWTDRSAAEANVWQDVCWSESLNLAVAVSSGGANRVQTSPDGITWTARAASSAKTWSNVIWAEDIGLFIATNVNDGIAMTSPDGITWTDRTLTAGASKPAGGSGATGGNKTLAWSPDLGLAVQVMANNDDPIFTSPDGITWTQRTMPTTGANRPDWSSITWGGGQFVVLGRDGLTNNNQVATSPDGITWTESDPAVADVQPWRSIVWSEDLQLYVGLADNTDNDGLSVMTAQAGAYNSPMNGSVAGGTTVTIHGDGINGGFTVGGGTIRVVFSNDAIITALTTADCFSPGAFNFGDASDVVVIDATTLTCVTPASANETVNVVVWNQLGSCPNVLYVGVNTFTYDPPIITSIAPTSGTVIGGTPITVTGENLFVSNNSGHPGDVYFGVLLATDIVVVNATTITCVTPPYDSISSNPVDITYNPPQLHIQGGVQFYSSTVLPAAYTYTASWVELNEESGFDPDIVIPLLTLIPIDTCSYPLIVFIITALNYLSTGVGAADAVGIAATYPLCIPCQILALLWGTMGLRGDLDLANTLANNFPACDFPKLSKFFFPPLMKPLRYQYSAVGTPNDNGWWLSVTDKFNGAALIVNNAIPRNPRAFTELSPFATGSAGMMGGFPGPSAVWNNRLVYARGGYVVSTDRPPIHIFDGQFDRQIVEVPETSGGAVPFAVTSMLSANGTIYVATLDSGATDADWSGRVFELDVETAQLIQVGETFPAGNVPYALAYHANRLWCGTMKSDPTNSGKLYSFRPDVTSTWTQELDLATVTQGGVTSLLSFEGLLYVGCSADTGTFAKVLVRGVDTTYTTSLTATGGVARENNAFLAMVEFDGNLYASYWNPDTTKVSKIYKFDGSSWTTVFNASTTASRIPYVGFPQDEDTLLIVGGGLTYDAQLWSTTNGTSWSDRSAFLTQGSPNATGLPVFGAVVR